MLRTESPAGGTLQRGTACNCICGTRVARVKVVAFRWITVTRGPQCCAVDACSVGSRCGCPRRMLWRLVRQKMACVVGNVAFWVVPSNPVVGLSTACLWRLVHRVLALSTSRRLRPLLHHKCVCPSSVSFVACILPVPIVACVAVSVCQVHGVRNLRCCIRGGRFRRCRCAVRCGASRAATRSVPAAAPAVCLLIVLIVSCRMSFSSFVSRAPASTLSCDDVGVCVITSNATSWTVKALS